MMDTMRIGYVSAVDKKTGMVSVIFPGDDATTDYLPYLSPGREYYPPNIDDMVLVAYHSQGAQGVCLGTFWNRDNLPDFVEGVQKTYTKDSYIRYNPEQDTIIISAGNIVFETSDGMVSVSDLVMR